MKRKATLYRIFIQRSADALSSGHYLQSAWLSYAVLEDRLRSLLRSSGGELVGTPPAPIQMMGPKLKKLKQRLLAGGVLQGFTVELHARINSWKDARNNLMHAMAHGTQTLAEIDAASKQLATDGEALVREVCAVARRVKRRSAQRP